MRLFNLIDTYKALTESVLSTEFTIGFELEGICTTQKSSDHSLPGYHDKTPPRGTAKELKDKLDELIGVSGTIGSDSSVHPDNRGGWSFEYASGIIPFNPPEFSKLLRILRDELPKLNIYTNGTCGFHCHLSYDTIDKEDAIWTICCISIDEELKKELTQLKYNGTTIDFYSDQYANKRFYETMKDALINKDWEKVQRVINGRIDDEKYRNIRLHPHGTLEWRGPRGFLQDADLIKEFMKKLYRVIFMFGKITDKKVWKGDDIEINRKEITNKVILGLDFDSRIEKAKKAKAASIEEKIKNNPMLLASLRPTQIKQVLENSSFNDRFFSNLTNEQAYELWNKIPDNVRYNYFQIINSGSRYPLQTWMQKIRDYDYILPDRYIEFFKNYDDFMKTFGNHLNGLPLILIKDYNKFNDKNNIKKYILEHSDLIPMEAWDYLLKPEMWNLLYNLDMPVKIQRKFVKKNPYNIQYIKNPDQSIVDSLKTKVPDIEQFIPRYYK